MPANPLNPPTPEALQAAAKLAPALPWTTTATMTADGLGGLVVRREVDGWTESLEVSASGHCSLWMTPPGEKPRRVGLPAIE